MSTCYAHVGLLTCDREKRHDGPHRDDWIMSAPVKFTKRPDPAVQEENNA